MDETEFVIAKSMEREQIERSQKAINAKNSETNNLIIEAQKL